MSQNPRIPEDARLPLNLGRVKSQVSVDFYPATTTGREYLGDRFVFPKSQADLCRNLVQSPAVLDVAEVSALKAFLKKGGSLLIWRHG
jgi:hypothetical protein